MMRSLLTTDGKITYSRYVLRPADSCSMEKLLETDGSSTVIPLDCALHVNRLPFKMTVSMMLEVAFYATVLGSYQAAEDIIGKIYGTPVNDDTIRLVVNHIGKAVFETDCRAADECMEQLEKGRLLHSSDKDGIRFCLRRFCSQSFLIPHSFCAVLIVLKIKKVADLLLK